MNPPRGAAGSASMWVHLRNARRQLRHAYQYGAHQPVAVPLGLLEGPRLLPSGGPLILYGPWLKDGVPVAQSNLDFDADLKRRDPEWGLRTVEDFAAAAEQRGFDLIECRPMPANNMMLRFRRR